MRTACAIAVLLSYGLGCVAPLGAAYADSYTDGMFQQGTEQYYRYEEQNRRAIEAREQERQRADDERRRNEETNRLNEENRQRSEAQERYNQGSSDGGGGGGGELLGLALLAVFLFAASEQSSKAVPSEPAQPQGEPALAKPKAQEQAKASKTESTASYAPEPTRDPEQARQNPHKSVDLDSDAGVNDTGKEGSSYRYHTDRRYYGYERTPLPRRSYWRERSRWGERHSWRERRRLRERYGWRD